MGVDAAAPAATKPRRWSTTACFSSPARATTSRRSTPRPAICCGNTRGSFRPTRGLACKRNIALFGDRLYVPTSDDHMVALDVKTGDVVWDCAVADYKKGWQTTGGPLVAKGKVLQGIVGQAPGGGAHRRAGCGHRQGGLALPHHRADRASSAATAGTACRWRSAMAPRSGPPAATIPQLNLAYFGVGQTYDTGPLLHPSTSRASPTTASTPTPRWPSIRTPASSSGTSSMCATISGTSTGPSSSR